MARTATQHSARFDADIEYYPDDVEYGEEELVSVWGCDDTGRCYFIYFVDGIFDDNLTEEA